LPESGWTTRLRTTRLDVVQAAAGVLAEGSGPRLKPPVPDAGAISRMDEAFAWLRLIPEDRYVLRRILGARALTHPLTLRHLHSWRRIAALLGADHSAVRRWHAEGIGLILRSLAGSGSGR
jgi:hypothetical protein